jgi:hypothetical protein
VSCSIFDASMRREPVTIADDAAARVIPDAAGQSLDSALPVESGSVGEPCDIDLSLPCKVPASTPCSLPADASGRNGVQRCLPLGAGGALAYGGCECLTDLLITDVPDCQKLSCPAASPYLVGCSLLMGGTDETEACIARTPVPDEIYVREGLLCSEGVIDGHLYCSTVPSSTPIGPSNCPTDRVETVFVAAAADCP